MTGKSMLSSLLTATAISLAIGGTTTLWFNAELDRQIAIRPPIVVIDYGPIAAGLAKGATSAEIQPHFGELKRRAAAYRDAGYIVLNRVAVDAAPAGMLVAAPKGLPPDWQTPLPLPGLPAASTPSLPLISGETQP